MRFWDASAVVPLCLMQPTSARVEALYGEDPGLVVWWGTPVECGSAFARLRREGVLDLAAEEAALAALERLRCAWHEVQPTPVLWHHALRLLRVHPLRAADALQLAAALTWAGGPSPGELVTLDETLAAAARLEGLPVV
ncbi:MAG: PIN domain-containing protein [Gemmatimonadota bacterium]